MKKVIRFLYLFLLVPMFISAQQNDKYNIFGYVRDDITGEGVGGVLVEAISESDTTQRNSAITNAEGKYVFELTTSVNKNEKDIKMPFSMELKQNYPNPFNPSTTIQFYVSKPSEVRLFIYNMLGQQVRTLINTHLSSGFYSLRWDATDEQQRGVPAGLYIYQLYAEEQVLSKKMILLDGAYGSVDYGSKYESPILQHQESLQSDLSKTNTLTVTLRFTGAQIETKEERHVSVLSQNFRYDVEVRVRSHNILNKEYIAVSEPDSSGKVFVGGRSGMVNDRVTGTEKVTVSNRRTHEDVSMRVNYDGGFPLMSLKGEVGDTLTIFLSKNHQSLGEAQQYQLAPFVPPAILYSNATNGEKDIVLDFMPMIYFSEMMDMNTIDEQSFTLSYEAGIVGGTIGTMSDQTVIYFDPEEPLRPLTEYTLRVATGVKDQQGLALEEPFEITFQTGSGILDTRIAYEFSNDIYTMNSEGSERKPLTKITGNFIDYYPDYSPDGNRIVFSRVTVNWPNNKVDLFMMNWDGSFLENLTNTSQHSEREAAFSPDGQKIAFISDQDGNNEIYVMGLNGSNPANLTNHPANDWSPDWSPDGQSLIFVSDRNGEDDIFKMNSDGTTPVNLTSQYTFDHIYNIACSHDGTQIVFGASDYLYVMDVSGSNLKELTSGGGWIYYKVSWSPDDLKIVFALQDDCQGESILTIHRDGTNRKTLIPYDGFDYGVSHPDWCPRRHE